MALRRDPISKPDRQKEPTAGYVAVGRVLAPRGLRGEFRVEPLTDFPERFEVGRSLYIGGDRYLIEACSWYRGRLYIKLSGVNSADAAAHLHHCLLEIPDSELKPLAQGEYYRFQVIGLSVRTTTGLPLGRVREVLTTGSNDVFVVHGMMGEVLLPAIGEVVKKIDLEAGYIEVELISGLVTRPPRAGQR